MNFMAIYIVIGFFATMIEVGICFYKFKCLRSLLVKDTTRGATIFLTMFCFLVTMLIWPLSIWAYASYKFNKFFQRLDYGF